MVTILGVAAAVIGICFLIFCWIGFHRTARSLVERRKSPHAFPLYRKQACKNRQVVFFLGTILSAAVLHGQTHSASSPMAAGGGSTDVKQQTQAAPPTASTADTSSAPLAAPAMVGPLHTAAPNTFDAGPFGKLAFTGVLSGFGYWQSNPATSDQAARADISNGQLFLQKTSGLVQYFLQAGAYNIPALGTPFLSTRNTIRDFFGPLPQAYLKLAPKGDFSLLIGKIPTLIGAEDTFTFQNLNIERGLLWNQENAVNRGMQLNYNKGKISGSLAWNDGFYSNRYNWLTGSITDALTSADSLEFVAGGNLGRTAYSSAATPLYQNNSSIYNAIYTHTASRWMIEPYFQYTRVPTDTRIGVARTTATAGAAILGNYTFSKTLSLSGRVEFIGGTGSSRNGAVNLIYGPGSDAWSVTMTPTYQTKNFFARAELSATQAVNYTSGDALGSAGDNSSQVRGVIETGFMF